MSTPAARKVRFVLLSQVTEIERLFLLPHRGFFVLNSGLLGLRILAFVQRLGHHSGNYLREHLCSTFSEVEWLRETKASQDSKSGIIAS
jgi:hypothetical protein